jgi:hypothetical protein
MHPETIGLALLKNSFQTSRAIGIRMGGHNQIDSVSFVMLPEMLDSLFPCIREPAIDHNNNLFVAPPENVPKAQRDCIAALLFAYRKKSTS